MATPALEGLKVVSAQEMAKIEGMAYSEGASEHIFMENAGAAVADAVESFIEGRELPKVVTLLVGKGNNGGDAFAAGAKLIERGFKTIALHIFSFDACSPLCKAMYEKFRSRGGVIHHVNDEKSFAFELDGIILDGLVGTGFKGRAEDALARAITRANASGLPILAIDIPSGLNGTTGDVDTLAIHATETISLELPKSGFFLKNGWDHVGTLRHVSFGLEKRYIAAAKPFAYLLNEEAIPHQLPPIKRSRHKYQAGYALAVAGSPGMPGAAILASYAVLRSGAGMVRLFHPEGMEAELSGAPYEVIRQGWNGRTMRIIGEQALRAKSMLIGPGISRTAQAKRMFKRLLDKIKLPFAIDADALFFLAEYPKWKIPKGSVLTPHRGEMDRLLVKISVGKAGLSYHERCQAYAETKHTTVILKGAPTFVFHPGTTPLIVTRGDPGMATAGSGDVLTGMLAGLMAQGLDAKSAAAVAVYLHGIAGEIAAQNLTSYSMTASDLLDFLPEAFSSSLHL